MTGIYIHFPYCLAKCPYCDFVSYVPAGAVDHRGYADAVLSEIESRAELFCDRRLETVFFGGGTPSLWDPHELARVLRGLTARAFSSGSSGGEVEITVECNPTSLDEERARALAQAGVGRLSIGVQSLDDERLRFLGRLHDARGGVEAVRAALRAGFRRVSADLIFGLPGQGPEDARKEALTLADMGLSHISAYQLTIESGTRFGELARLGRLPMSRLCAEEGVVAESFLAIDDALASRGLSHYEVSNYARPGEEARHNLGYWRGNEYIGLGCAAVGFVRTGARGTEPARGLRWRNEVRPERYVSGEASAMESREELDAEALMRERIMLGLRMREGVHLDECARELGIPGGGWTEKRTRAAAWLEERGRIRRERGRVVIPQSAWLWTDDTAARLF